MKFLFEEITGKPRHYIVRETSWFPVKNEQTLLTAVADISVFRRGRENVVLQGTLEGQLLVVCDRCGKQIKEPFSGEFEYLITTRKAQILEQNESECSDEDAVTLYLEGPEIDVDEILQEQAYLTVPLKALCSENCKGICAGCGVVLNSEACRCPSDGVHATFALLKKLINN